MQDILGRELHDGDIVVTKGNQATGSKRAMAVGIYQKKSVRIQGGKWRTAKDMFLVENPTAVEQGIKDIILREIELEKANTEIRRKATAHQIADEPGTLYHFSDGHVYLYCGWAHVDYQQTVTHTQHDGHLYIPLWYGRNKYRPTNTASISDTWESVEQYINNHHITAVALSSIKILKKPGKYQEIYPGMKKIKLPSDFEFSCPTLGYTINCHLNNMKG